MSLRLSSQEKALIRRYLVWCYKTTKEELDRVDRKFTQLKTDGHIFKKLKSIKVSLPPDGRKEYDRLCGEFMEYIRNKEKSAEGTNSAAGYLYLKNRLAAVESAIAFFLGKRELAIIASLYEEEMTRRILEAREHS